jgi:hypothetical protein
MSKLSNLLVIGDVAVRIWLSFRRLFTKDRKVPHASLDWELIPYDLEVDWNAKVDKAEKSADETQTHSEKDHAP